MRNGLLLLLLAGPALPEIAAQQPDSIILLPDLVARGTRRADDFTALSSTTVSAASRPSGRFADLTDALSYVPGIQISNRWNWSLDQRVVIRGSGARANFGLRGIRVMLDGIPQTLPDGQGTLTLADMPGIREITVLRGAGSALHGNAAGGVIALSSTTELPAGRNLEVTAAAGSFDSRRLSILGATSTGPVAASISGSRFTSSGMRNHSATEQYRISSSITWRPAPTTALIARFSLANDPVADNPGALTPAEYENDPSAAAPANIARNAGKAVRQSQLALGVDHGRPGISITTRAWLGSRRLDNPLASPVPATVGGPDLGTWVSLDRSLIGIRTAATFIPTQQLSVTLGWDAQRSIDDRSNRPHRAGEITGSAWFDQQERMSERGLFAQGILQLTPEWTVRGGARHDAVSLDVADRIAAERGGKRTMTAPSSNIGVQWQRNSISMWVARQSLFETPTTTELANRPDGTTGLNRDLEPQQGHSIETGIRYHDSRIRLEAVAWRQQLDQTISPVAELGGRSFYDNIGSTRMTGVEAAISGQVRQNLELVATWMTTDAIFGEGAATPDGRSLTGNMLPGIARSQLRVGATARSGIITASYDHAFRSSIAADDLNLIGLDGWGTGIGSFRIAGRAGAMIDWQIAIDNVFDRRHVAGVIVNGAAGRVVEPGAGRTVMVGVVARPSLD